MAWGEADEKWPREAQGPLWQQEEKWRHTPYFPSFCLPRLVSSVQAIMASTAGYIVSTSCKHIIDDQ